MPVTVDHFVVGAGHAGMSAAAALVKTSGADRVLVVSAEREYPYQRYMLSKQYLQGRRSRERVALHRAKAFEQSGGQMRLGTRVMSLDVEHRLAKLDSGEEIEFRRLLLATGASARKLPIPGGDLPEVHYLRTLADADVLLQAAAPGRHVVIVGGGFVGAEVAASLTQRGLRATIVDVVETLWAHLFGQELGRFFEGVLKERGVEVLAPAHVERFEGEGRVERVVLREGNILPCDFVLVGVGVRPETALAEQAGLRVDNGIVVDEYLQTSAADVFAAGDAARFYSPVFETSMRIEHWEVAGQQGTVAASNMLGQRRPFDEVPYFFSDLFDVSLEFLGYVPSWDDLVMRWFAPERFTALFIKEESVHGALLVNNGNELKHCRELIKQRIHLEDLGRLGDPAVSLSETWS